MPSTLGNFRSSKMRRGSESDREDRKSSASCPSRATWILLLSFSLRSACKQSSTSSALSSTKRISISSCCGITHLVRSLYFWKYGGVRDLAQSEIERRPLFDRRFSPHGAAMLVNDAGNGR